MDLEWEWERLGDPKFNLPVFADYLRKSGAFTKLDIPFSLNLIIPPPRPKKPL